jgi:hypothetical protein
MAEMGEASRADGSEVRYLSVGEEGIVVLSCESCTSLATRLCSYDMLVGKHDVQRGVRSNGQDLERLRFVPSQHPVQDGIDTSVFTVIPYDTHSPTKLLNYLTAPDCVIYTAGTSPFLYLSDSTDTLDSSHRVRRRTGYPQPRCADDQDEGWSRPSVGVPRKAQGWQFASRYSSSYVPSPPPFLQPSIDAHIVTESLHLLYNVNFSIVSQVNRPSHSSSSPVPTDTPRSSYPPVPLCTSRSSRSTRLASQGQRLAWRFLPQCC